MDSNYDQTSDQAPKKPLIILVISILVAFMVGIVLGNGLSSSKTPQQASKDTEVPQSQKAVEEKIPIGISLLENPIIYQWSGSVDGTLTDKTADSITIAKDGNTITIPVVKASQFFGLPQPVPNSNATKRENITLNDLTIGTRLRGDFFAFPWEGKGVIKAGTLVIVDPKE